MLILLFVLVIILFIWLGAVTYFFWSLSGHYNNLVRGSNKKTLQSALDSLLDDVTVAKKDIVKLSKTCDTIIADSRLYIQKVGLLRFNPFKETGGEQSFILALLDKNDSGIVISGLYARSGMRWYAKHITKGKGTEHELSVEEKQAIENARPVTD